MRRDICHFYPIDMRSAFYAHRDAIKQVFNKKCDETPFVKLTFGLNYSFKYNMNGGACTLHFMPYGNGTAVNIRYSIVQLFGARYEAHERVMKECVQKLLNLWASDVKIPVDEFERYAANYSSQQQYAPPPQQQYMQPPMQQPPYAQPQQPPYAQPQQPPYAQPQQPPYAQPQQPPPYGGDESPDTKS